MNGLQMSCRQVERLVQSMVDGMATEQEQRGVNAHAAACPRCQATLAEAQQLRALLAGQPTRTVSDNFELRLKQSLATRVSTPSSPWEGVWERFRLRYGWRLQMPALCAAGSLAVLVVAVTVAPRLSGVPAISAVDPVHVVRNPVPRPDVEAPGMDWDTMQASVDLSTGSVLDQ